MFDFSTLQDEVISTLVEAQFEPLSVVFVQVAILLLLVVDQSSDHHEVYVVLGFLFAIIEAARLVPCNEQLSLHNARVKLFELLANLL